ncbi:MAG: acyltransferase, partial [Chloroflexota bacterium]|nr:acyltransferase [Chloroflexota bacterium]
GEAPMQPVRSFLIRRAVRILPLYYVAILIVWTWRYSGRREEWVDLAQHLTFTHIFDRTHIFWTIGPAWSLAVEVHFYLALGLLSPLIVTLCLACKSTVTRHALLLGGTTLLWVVGLAVLGINAFVRDIPEANAPAWFGLPAKLDNFAIGMMLAAVVASPVTSMRFGPRAALLLRIAGFAVIAAVFSMRTVESVPSPLGVRDIYAHSLSAVGFALILASTVLGPRESRWTEWLSHRALAWAGVISYSVYIWHEPIMIELGKRDLILQSAPEWFPFNAVVLVTFSILAGIASYWTIERPTMEMRYLFDRRGRLRERYEPHSVPARATDLHTSNR